MKLTIPLTPLQRYKEFPITRTKTFLAHAAASPFPSRICSELETYCSINTVSGQWEYLHKDIEAQTRERAAELVGAEVEEIAFVSSTSAGLSTIACGLPWQNGDNVIVADGDFPSNIYPWLNLSNLGVEVRFISRNSHGRITVNEVMQLVDRKTKLVALSSVNYVTGYRINIEEIGKSLHNKGILFCVDAVQSLGSLPFVSKYVDFAAASAHKWLLGPMGIGILYVKRTHFNRLRPTFTGWKAVKDNKTYLKYNLNFVDSAQRYEAGSPNVLGIIGLHAALGIILEAGVSNIANRLAELRSGLINSLNNMGYEVISPNDVINGSAIVSFTHKDINISDLRERLDVEDFVVSMRDTLDGRTCIRVAPHFYNSDQEISTFLTNLAATTNHTAFSVISR